MSWKWAQQNKWAKSQTNTNSFLTGGSPNLPTREERDLSTTATWGKYNTVRIAPRQVDEEY